MTAIHLKKPYRSPSILSRRNKLVKETKKQTLIMDPNQGLHETGDHVRRISDTRKIVRTKAGDVVFDHGLAIMENDERAAEACAEMQEKDRIPGRYHLVKNREGMYRDSLDRHFFGSWPEMPWKKVKHNE